MSIVRFLIAWANVPFTIAAGIALLFALLQMTGVLGLLAGDHDGDHDVDHDVDHEVDHEVDADHDADAEAEDGHSIGDYLLGPLGFGKIPFSIIWQTYAVAFAAAGLALNARYLSRPGGPPIGSLWWTTALALVAGYGVVALIARFLGPVLSSTKEEATSRGELVGQTGVVISSRVTSEFGEVRIRDKSGHDLRVVCKLADGAAPPREHQRVVVVEYEGGELRVAPLDEDDVEEVRTRGERP